MKHIWKREEEPERLAAYRKHNPNASWDKFRHSRENYRAVKQALLEDQHGLCAYCEISIQEALRPGRVDDFRVEHFFPKSASQRGHNFHLDWRNMLGVCHGGSQPNVEEASLRYTDVHSERSCDVLKGNKQLASRILNPLEVPAELRIFRYDLDDGRMRVDTKNCPSGLRRLAENSIRELNLNAARLMRLRLEVIRTLFDMEIRYLDEGMEAEAVYELMAEEWLTADEEGNILPFFSVMRYFLGDVAEAVLARYQYKI